MHRRTLLRGIAASSFAFALGARPQNALTLQAPVLTSLDVLFHGLFGFGYNSSTNKIEIHIPTVTLPGHKHVYRAGSWVTPNCDDDSVHEPDMTAGEEYRLQLTNFTPIKTGFPAPVPDSEVRLLAPVTMDYSKRYCYLEMPATPLFRAAHRASRFDNFPFFVGDAVRRDKIKPTNIARTYVFTYKSSTPFEAQVLTKSGQQFWAPLSSNDPLHCFAQPLDSIPAGHEDVALDAFEQLRAMCGYPSIFPVPFHVADISSADNSPDEETSLGERDCYNAEKIKIHRQQNGPAPAAGGEVANCVGMIFPRP